MRVGMDFEDLGRESGSDAVRAALDAARWAFPDAPPHGDASGESSRIAATPFVWRAEADIPHRRWLYGKHLLRKFLSLDIAAGGVGKSSVKIVDALAMSTGRNLYGKELPEGPLTVWIYNLEDPADETERRLHAAAKYFHIRPEEVGSRLYVDSGRDQRCVIAEEIDGGARIIRPVTESIIEEIKARGIDVLILDPFVSSHQVSENDNRAIDLVAKEWGRIADVCDCSINLVHHVRKQNGQEANADSARGAKSLTDAARSVVVYNRMTKEEGEQAGIKPDQVGFHFRAQNDKANLAPPEAAEWYRMNNVSLDNGDQVGVAASWSWPDAFDGISLTKTKEVQRAVGKGEWREDVRSRDKWVGNIIAEILSMDPDDDRKRIGRMVKEWVKNDVLRIVEKDDEKRMTRKFVEVGNWITD